MNSVTDFPLQVAIKNSASQVPAILNELHFKLKQLVETGENSSVDLRSLPLFPGDYELLKQHLGSGEVRVQLNAMGPSEIYETAIPGIWWIKHFNNDKESVADFIEITAIPALLITADVEIRSGVDQIEKLMASIID